MAAKIEPKHKSEESHMRGNEEYAEDKGDSPRRTILRPER